MDGLTGGSGNKDVGSGHRVGTEIRESLDDQRKHKRTRIALLGKRSEKRWTKDKFRTVSYRKLQLAVRISGDSV
jgi:hypothetical protein